MKKLSSFRIRLILIIMLLFPIFSLVNSCKKSSDLPAANEVFIQGGVFTPSSITVSAGTTITWINKDGTAHTVTSNTGLFDSGSISNNGSWSHLFSVAGSFPYKCTFHSGMTGTVTVN